LNLTDHSRQKYPVQTGKNIRFIKLDISNKRISKNKCRKIEGKGYLSFS
jgi:hypothetical protein